ncbi:MAG TPA: hypothetical protein VE130_11490 [Nitrososphaeraceae archaeon]|nr:hypothetical protein [Nitrososphaeraceae archaeon]
MELRPDDCNDAVLINPNKLAEALGLANDRVCNRDEDMQDDYEVETGVDEEEQDGVRS